MPLVSIFNFIFLTSYFNTQSLLSVSLLISLIFSTTLAYSFNTFLYKKLKKEETNINAYLKFIILDFSLINSFLTTKADKCLNFIESIVNYNYPISKTFQEILTKIQFGRNPEKELKNLFLPSKDFMKFIEELIINNFDKNNLTRIGDFSTSENEYEVFTRSIESKLSIIFFIGLFVPIGTCFLILLQVIKSFILIFVIPLYFLTINYFSSRFLNESVKLIGIIGNETKNDRREFNDFLVFLKNFAITLSYKKSPEFALFSAYRKSHKKFQRRIIFPISSLLKNSISLGDTIELIKSDLKSTRTRLILNVLKKMVYKDTFHTAESIWALLKIISTHQKLEKKKIIIIKGEQFKSLIFIFLLPFILGIISGTFPAFFYYLNLLNTTDLSSSVIFYFSYDIIDIIILFCSFLLSNTICTYFFLKMINTRPRNMILFSSNLIYVLFFFMSFSIGSSFI